MKIWIRVVVGSIIGLVLGAVLGESGGDTPAFFADAATFVSHVGRYVLFALVFLNILVGTYELLESRKMLRVYLQLALYLLVAAIAAVLVGSLAVLVLSPERVAIFLEEGSRIENIEAASILLEIFPTNVFHSFVTPGNVLLPIAIVGLVVGLAAYREQNVSGQVVSFMDSFSQIVYRINSFVVEIIGVGLIAVAASFVFSMRSVDDFSIFADLVLVALFVMIFFVMVVYPVAIYFLCGRESPFRFLFGILTPALVAFFSGDTYLAIGSGVRVGRENLGHPRMVTSAVYPLATIFGRVGTAMVTAVAFFVVLRSYSSLEITFGQFVWVAGSAFATSFLLGSVPASGVVVGLSMMSSWYGQGLEEAYLMLMPVVPLLISIGALMDTITTLVVGHVIVHREKLRKEVLVEDFI